MMKEKLCYVGYNIHAEIKLAQVVYRYAWAGMYLDVPDVHTWMYLMYIPGCTDVPDVHTWMFLMYKPGCT